MEPRIQYAKTSDGVNIAFAVMGSGVPLVHALCPLSHLLLDWRSPVWHPWLEALADRYQLVIYDGRGNGMSQRGLTAYAPEAPVLDLEAVVNHLSLNRFFTFAALTYGHGALRFAAANPDRTAGLILWTSFVSARALDQTVGLMLAETNWDFFLQSIAQTANWLEPRDVRAYVDVLRQTMTQEDYLTLIKAAYADAGVEQLLPNVRTPTLVLHPSEFDLVKPQEAMRLASMMPNARLVLLEGASAIPTGELVEPALLAVKEFIDDVAGTEAAAGTARLAAEDVHTILFTDVEGSTAMTQRLGDARARDLLREHERMVREALKAHGGSEVKTMGDGFMASFSSATKALECAIAIQRAFAERNESAAEPILVRVGLNAGEPIAEDDDLYGTAVNEAARITAAAQGGEILVADVVRQLTKGKDFLFANRGETSLRGFEHPVRLFEVRWHD